MWLDVLIKVIGDVEVDGLIVCEKKKSGDFLCQYMLGKESIHMTMRSWGGERRREGGEGGGRGEGGGSAEGNIMSFRK